MAHACATSKSPRLAAKIALVTISHCSVNLIVALLLAKVVKPDGSEEEEANLHTTHSCQYKQPKTARRNTGFTLPRLVYALESMLCMLSAHCAIGLQTDCMVIVLVPVIEAARLPRECPIALGYGLLPL